MVVTLRRGAPDSAGTTLPSAGGLLRDPVEHSPMKSCCPGVKSCVQSVGADFSVDFQTQGNISSETYTQVG